MCAKNCENWLLVDNAMAKNIRLTFLAHPVVSQSRTKRGWIGHHIHQNKRKNTLRGGKKLKVRKLSAKRQIVTMSYFIAE